MKPQAKVSRVMREFKKGDLKSSSGQKVTNPKQAIAIGLSEAGISKKAKGGEMKESKAMMKKEVSFMKKKGAPKSMLKHEMAEMKGMKKGGSTKKMAMGGMGQIPITPRVANPVSRPPTPRPPNPVSRPPMPPVANPVSRPPTAPRKGPNPLTLNKPANTQSSLQSRIGKKPTAAASAQSMQNLGSAFSNQASLPGMMKKGGSVKKMASGGLAAGHKSADGIARKGKTKAEQVKMAKGGTAKMRKGGYC